jgi:hypothetical protein
MWDMITGYTAYLLANFSLHMVGQFGSLLLMLAMLVAFIRAHRDEANLINLEDMFAENGHIGGSKMRLNGAWLLFSWVIIYLTLNDKLTEWFVLAYIGAFVYDRQKARESEGKPM